MNYKGVKFVKTGAIRPPREGEWFKGLEGRPVLAQFDMNEIHTDSKGLDAMVFQMRCRPILIPIE